MARNKTQPTEASVEQYLAAIEDPQRRKDCQDLARLIAQATKLKPKMWGPAIVGFGSVKYPLAGGREGETCAVGFSSRKSDISLYGTGSAPDQAALLSRLGKHKMGKGCLYVRRLEDVDLGVLAQLIAGSALAKTG
jgi:hypothetical protein